MEINEAIIMKDNITEDKSVMVCLKKEIEAMSESGIIPGEQISWLFKFILKLFKMMSRLPNITTGHVIENTLCTCISF